MSLKKLKLFLSEDDLAKHLGLDVDDVVIENIQKDGEGISIDILVSTEKTNTDNYVLMSTKSNDLRKQKLRLENPKLNGKSVEEDVLNHVKKIGEVTRESAKITANALKSIYTRIHESNRVHQLLHSIGVDVGEFDKPRNAVIIINSLSNLWDLLSDEDKERITLEVAGIYNANRFNALMSNLKDYEKINKGQLVAVHEGETIIKGQCIGGKKVNNTTININHTGDVQEFAESVIESIKRAFNEKK